MIPNVNFFNIYDVGASQNGIYPITFPVFPKTNAQGSAHWVKVYLEDPTIEGRWVLQDEGSNLDYTIKVSLGKSELSFNGSIAAKYKKILIVSDLPIKFTQNLSPSDIVDGKTFTDELNKVYALLHQAEICCMRSVKTTQVNTATGGYYNILIDEYKSGDLLAFDGDTSKTRIIPAGYTITQLQVDKAAIEKAVKDAQAAAAQSGQFLTTIQGQITIANQAAANAESARQAAETAKTDAQQIKSDTQQLKADTQLIKSQTDQTLTQTQQIKSDTQALKADTQQLKTDTQQIKTDTQALIAKYPDPATMGDGDIVYNHAGATSGDNKFQGISFADYLKLINNPLSRYLDPSAGTKGNVLAVAVPDPTDSTKNTIVDLPIDQVLTDKFQPSDYDFLQYYKGQWRIHQMYRIDGQVQSGDVLIVRNTSSGEIVLRPSSTSGGIHSGSLSFTGEKDGSGVIAQNGLAIHRQVLNIDGQDPNAEYEGTIVIPPANAASGQDKFNLYIEKTVDSTGKVHYSTVTGSVDDGSTLKVDKSALPAGVDLSNTITPPPNLIDGACYNVNLCYDDATKSLKTNMELGGGGSGVTQIGVPKPTKDGQVPTSQQDPVTGEWNYKLSDLPLPDNTDPANTGRVVVQQANGTWGFADAAQVPAVLHDMMLGSWVLGNPTYTVANSTTINYAGVKIAYKDSTSGDEQIYNVPDGSVTVSNTETLPQFGYFDPADQTIKVDTNPPTPATLQSRVYLFEFYAGQTKVIKIGESPTSLPAKVNSILDSVAKPDGIRLAPVSGHIQIELKNDAFMHTSEMKTGNLVPGFLIPKGILDIEFYKQSDGKVQATQQDWLLKKEDSKTHALSTLGSTDSAWYLLYIRISDGKYFCAIPTEKNLKTGGNSFTEASVNRLELIDNFDAPPADLGNLYLIGAVLVKGNATDFSNATQMLLNTNHFHGAVAGPSTAGNLNFTSTGYIYSTGNSFNVKADPVDLTNVADDEAIIKTASGLDGVPVSGEITEFFPLRILTLGPADHHSFNMAPTYPKDPALRAKFHVNKVSEKKVIITFPPLGANEEYFILAIHNFDRSIFAEFYWNPQTRELTVTDNNTTSGEFYDSGTVIYYINDSTTVQNP